MAKTTLNNLTSMANQAGFLVQLNQNFDRLSDAIDDAISRTGLEPNQLETDVDFNSHRLFNLPDATSDTEPVTYGHFQELAAALAVEGGYAYSPALWTFTGNGSDTVYALAGAPLSVSAVYRVAVNGVVLNPADDYTISSVTEQITFDSAPTGEVSVVCMGFAVPVVEGSVAVNAVGTMQIQNNAVTLDKLPISMLSADAAGRSRMADGFVNTDKLAAGSVTSSILASTLDFSGKTLTGLPSAPSATTSTAGLIEVATTAEAQAGTDSSRALTPAGMKAAQIQRSSPVATTSGKFKDVTDIPAWAKRITIVFDGVSLTGADYLTVQLGDSGGIETSGYVSTLSSGGTAAQGSSCFLAAGNTSGNATEYMGAVTLFNVSGNTWVMTGVTGSNGISVQCVVNGRKTLSDTLTRVRVTTFVGTLDFDAGSFSVFYE